MDMCNTDEILTHRLNEYFKNNKDYFYEYLYNIANFVTIKYNLYFMKHKIYNIIVKNKTKKNKNSYVAFYLINDKNAYFECVNLYIDNVGRRIKENNHMIMNPITGELCCKGSALERINNHIEHKDAITKYIVTRNEIKKILETSINLKKLHN
ncbi:hypothetical protein [Fowlpox virus]|nr:hypothetical protein [Fowlpox virus]